MERSTPLLHQTVNRLLDGLIQLLTVTLDSVLTFRVQRAQAETERVEQNLRELMLYQELIREYRQETLEQEWYRAKQLADVAADMEAWDAASDEALENFEASLN